MHTILSQEVGKYLGTKTQISSLAPVLRSNQWHLLRDRMEKKIFYRIANKILLKKIIQYRVWDIYDGQWAIKWASQWGYIYLVMHLLEDDRIDSDYAIIYASFGGSVELVRQLLSHPRIDPSCRDNTSLRHASLKGHIEIVKLLLNDERVINGSDIPFKLAVRENRYNIVKLFIVKNMCTQDAVFNASRTILDNHYVEMLEIFMKYDPRRVIRGRINAKELLHCITTGNLIGMKMLLKYPSVTLSLREKCAIIKYHESGELNLFEIMRERIKRDI